MKNGIAIIAAAVLAGFAPPRAAAALTVREATAGLGYAATSVNGAVFRAGSLTSLSNTQYIAYYDAEGYVVLGKRNLGETAFTTQRTIHTGNINDGHNVISIIVDGDGYIHAAFDHHGHSLRYARSVEPGSLALGEKESMVGENESNVTYPEFHRLSDGSLLFFYRDGASGNGNLVLNRYDLATRKWSRVQTVLIDGENARNAYPQMCVGRDDSIHVSWVWRETSDVATNHDICYAASRDGGATWEKSDGTAYALPITLSTAEVVCSVAQNSSLMNQTSMTTMPDGRPVIATYWKASGDAAPQYRLVYKAADGAWKTRQVGSRTGDFSLGGWGTKRIPISRPQVVCDAQRMMVIVRDEERGSKVTLYSSTPTDDGEWSVRDLTGYAVNAWEPSYDRELWKERGWLDIYVQDMEQGDGENVTTKAPTLVRMLELSGEASIEGASENETHDTATATIDLSDIAKAYGIDLADESSRARLALVVDAGGSQFIATIGADGRATVSWTKRRSMLVQDVEFAVAVDGVEVFRRVEPLILCASSALFDAVVPEGGEWTVSTAEGAVAVADGRAALVAASGDASSPAKFDLTPAMAAKRVVVVDFKCRFSDAETLPGTEAMPSSAQTAIALSGGVLYAWTDGGWTALEGAEVEDGGMYSVRLVLDYRRGTVGYGIWRDGEFCMLSRADGEAKLALGGSAFTGIDIAGTTGFARLDGVLLERNGAEDAGIMILVR